MSVKQIEARMLSEKDTCKYIGMSRSYLANSRMEGARGQSTSGPPWHKCGAKILYSLRDLDEWLAAHRHVPEAS